jgi:putative resolvase
MSLHPKHSGSREELRDDFSPLATIFAGRMYGMGSAGARRRLLAESAERCGGGGR